MECPSCSSVSLRNSAAWSSQALGAHFLKATYADEKLLVHPCCAQAAMVSFTSIATYSLYARTRAQGLEAHFLKLFLADDALVQRRACGALAAMASVTGVVGIAPGDASCANPLSEALQVMILIVTVAICVH